MGRSCAFFECKATTGLHAFPKERDRILLWLRAMGRSATTNTSAMFVCNRHFTPQSYENYGMVQMGLTATSQLRLRPDAMPIPAAFLLPSNAVSSCLVVFIICVMLLFLSVTLTLYGSMREVMAPSSS